MPNVSFAQADIENLIRTAKRVGAVIKFDIRTSEVTTIPDNHRSDGNVPGTISEDNLIPDGPKNREED